MIDEWFQQVPRLLTRTDEVYEELVNMGKRGKLAATVRKVYEQRGWEPSKRLIGENLYEAVASLNMFYCPKALVPGPTFVFPMRDLYNRWPWAQTRPMPGSVLYDEERRYRIIGTDYSFLGPKWFGNDPATLQRIIDTGKVVLVEGPFDLLACKALVPDLPLLSSGTKGLSEDHRDYLRILAVRHIAVLYDNERSGQGDKGARKIARDAKFAKVEVLTCPANDPSEALCTRLCAERLRDILKAERP
jgi:hypothetical protein